MIIYPDHLILCFFPNLNSFILKSMYMKENYLLSAFQNEFIVMDLSKEYTKFLDTEELSDTEILVGKEPNTKIFRLHSLILMLHSPYFRAALSDNWIKIENGIIKFKKPNISVEVFDIIVKYIYSGKLYHENDFKINVELLIAADELCLDNLCSCTEEYLLTNDKESLERNFVLVQKIASQFNNFSKLFQFCKENFEQDPSLIFRANDFTMVKQETLLDLLKRSDQSLKPIKVWDKVVEWCTAQSVESQTDIWTAEEELAFKDLIQSFIPYINFKEICPEDFLQKIKPFKRFFDNDFYINILEYYSFNDDIHLKFKMSVDSKIINSEQAFLICNFIKFMTKNDFNTFYKLNLLIRGSRDGFEWKSFENLCDNKGPTITVARIKNANEIIGGYNHLKWKSFSSRICTKENFIFSLDTNNLGNSVFSKVEDESKALRNSIYLPDFGDLYFLIDSTNNNKGQYYKKSYEKSIRKSEGEFEIDDYEVFQVVNN